MKSLAFRTGIAVGEYFTALINLEIYHLFLLQDLTNYNSLLFVKASKSVIYTGSTWKV